MRPTYFLRAISSHVRQTMSTQLKLELSNSPAQFSPRLGKLTIDRPHAPPTVLETPTLITPTSRGLVRHLSRDHVHKSEAIRLLNLHFESFLENNPPIPIGAAKSHKSFHDLCGLDHERHVTILSLRDQADVRVMPANGADAACVNCIRGVRRVSPAAWSQYLNSIKPDLVVALVDEPMTEGPHSQKRITKSIERTILWLGKFLSALDPLSISVTDGETAPNYPTNILLPMVGGSSPAARRAFASTLVESLEGHDTELFPHLESLDAAFSGYLFPLAPLYLAISQTTGQSTPQLGDLLRASLQQLSIAKPRIAYSAKSPHDILHLVRDVGIDASDASWAQNAADVGVALDFRFPVPAEHEPTGTAEGKRNVGHNLYLKEYSMDFHRFADTLLDAQSAASSSEGTSLPICSCLACSPVPPAWRIAHSKVDKPIPEEGVPAFQAPYTRAYVHHLLHTHEMSALSFLTMHNLAVADAFMAGIRHVLQTAPGTFESEVARFEAAYDGKMQVVIDAGEMWAQVERDRGKGRLKREKERELTKNAAEVGVDP